jgi:hypothetical protein
MNTAPRTSWKHCLFVELIPIPPPAANPGNEFHMDPWAAHISWLAILWLCAICFMYLYVLCSRFIYSIFLYIHRSSIIYTIYIYMYIYINKYICIYKIYIYIIYHLSHTYDIYIYVICNMCYIHIHMAPLSCLAIAKTEIRCLHC